MEKSSANHNSSFVANNVPLISLISYFLLIGFCKIVFGYTFIMSVIFALFPTFGLFVLMRFKTFKLLIYEDAASEPLKEDNSNKYDAIIVGSGLGGLSTAACLANNGKHVLVIEQHNIVGGCSTIFKRKGYKFDVGLHVLAGFGEPSPYNLMLKMDKMSGLREQSDLELVPLPELYRVVNRSGLDVTIPINMQEAIKSLSEQFPDEAAGIEKFFKTSSSINDDILKYNNSIYVYGINIARILSAFTYPTLVKGSLYDTAGAKMDSFFKSEPIKLALTAIIFFIATDPYVLPFTPYCFLFPMYMNDGAYYVKGGSQKLADAFAKIIKSHGGDIITGNKVCHLNTSTNEKAVLQWWNPFAKQTKVNGVEYSKTFGNDTTHTAYADTVILNSNLKTFPNLLSNEAIESGAVKTEVDKIDNIRLGTSCFCIYIAFNKRLPDLPNGKKMPYTTWSLGNAKCLRDVHDAMFAPFEDRYFIFSYYSCVDSGLEPEGNPDAGVGAVILPDRYQDWEKYDHTSQEYKDKKAECAKKVIAQLENIYPHISECIDFYEASTPLTMKRYLNTPYGDMYSWEISNKHYLGERPDLESDSIEGLYYASGWSGFSHGFPGVMTTGFRCARQIFKNEKKEIDKKNN